jgi:hypothetical protein
LWSINQKLAFLNPSPFAKGRNNIPLCNLLPVMDRQKGDQVGFLWSEDDKSVTKGYFIM